MNPEKLSKNLKKFYKKLEASTKNREFAENVYNNGPQILRNITDAVSLITGFNKIALLGNIICKDVLPHRALIYTLLAIHGCTISEIGRLVKKDRSSIYLCKKSYKYTDEYMDSFKEVYKAIIDNAEDFEHFLEIKKVQPMGVKTKMIKIPDYKNNTIIWKEVPDV